MRREVLYLHDIVEAAEALERFTNGRTRGEFEADDLLRSAVTHKLIIIGEAAARISSEVRRRYPQVAWPDIVGLRNVAVHDYFDLDLATIWATATQDAPVLRQQILGILSADYGTE
jgi:uncharacterized protein with HEPN domain